MHKDLRGFLEICNMNCDENKEVIYVSDCLSRQKREEEAKIACEMNQAVELAKKTKELRLMPVRS